jgi:hypothetical protein
MERRTAERRRRQWSGLWMRVAASFLLAAVAGGAGSWAWHDHQAKERARGEEARRQVMLALKITGHALNQVQENLAGHGQPEE